MSCSICIHSKVNRDPDTREHGEFICNCPKFLTRGNPVNDVDGDGCEHFERDHFDHPEFFLAGEREFIPDYPEF